jgi:hypothetical protein
VHVAAGMRHRLFVRAAPLLVLAAGLAASCQRAPRAEGPLPPSCVQFLLQARCWLRKSNNDAWEVDRALGAARASFEAPAPWGPPHAAADYCEMAQTFRRSKFEAIGCATASGDLHSLPASQPAACPPDQHFFVRRDGRVIGCRPDCVDDKDCPAGSSCASFGSAPGGPIDEPFCD